MRPLPPAAAALAMRFEGLRLAPYHDPVGFPTIGYGHLLSRIPGEDLSRYPTIDAAEAERLLQEDLARAARAVLRLVRAPLTDAQFAALVDFAFNVGAGNLEASTLRRVVERGEHQAVPRQLARWVYAGGVKLPGLVRRRRAEAELYATG